jgi:hypothetical protein
MDVVESGPMTDRADPTVSGAGIEPSAVVADLDRSRGALADGEVDGAGGARNERDGGGLVPLRTMRSVGCPRSMPSSSRLALHASLTRSPLNLNRTASVACTGDTRSALYGNATSSPR